MELSELFDGEPDDPTDFAVLCPPLMDAMVLSAEQRLGYRLPAAYLDLLRVRNGGYLTRSRFPTQQRTSWAEDHVPFDCVMGIGGPRAIDSDEGSDYLIREWGYPPVGVVVASDGHTAIMLDYSLCGPQGEPRVIWVDMEVGNEPEVVVLAPDFETFISRLEEQR